MSCTPDNRFSETVPFLLQRMSLFMAPNGPADPIERCLLLKAKQKTSAKRQETGKE